MRNQPSRQDLNQFITGLLRCYSHYIQQEEQPPSPHFMTRLQARINAHPAPPFFWATGIIKAQKWLVAFSLIAIIFFVTNLVFTTNLTMPYSDSSEAPGLTDHDWDHVNDEPIQISDASK